MPCLGSCFLRLRPSDAVACCWQVPGSLGLWVLVRGTFVGQGSWFETEAANFCLEAQTPFALPGPDNGPSVLPRRQT